MFNPMHIGHYTTYFYLYLVATGIALIVFGILFLTWPELLAYLVSFFFVLLGVTSLIIAWRVRQFEKNVKKKMESVADTIHDTMNNITDKFDAF
ncbi:MAG: DUF308 domain-containing protein [Patescibacteria group bacterium]